MENLIVTLQPKDINAERQFALVEENIDNKEFSLRMVDNPESEIALYLDEENSTFRLPENTTIFADKPSVISERFATLYRYWAENKNTGFDASTGTTEDVSFDTFNYNSENIYVENKPFSIYQLVDYIKRKTLIINPDFQRNFIWDRSRQSRLIESILLGLPLPSIYLSQFEDGTLTVVDGLQRLSSIYAFMNNELVLCNLEYLKECEGHTYAELESIISPLVYRMFDQTTIMCFVINRRSPSQLKYELFKRLNTGGVPLNTQEIRNCLSREPLQKALKRMVESKDFLQATCYSINNYRMDAQELALRFIYFFDEYSDDNVTGKYEGALDYALNKKVEELNRINDFSNYEEMFANAMKHAYSLFGSYTFRKVLPNDGQRRRINKSLFVAISVILAKRGKNYKQGVDIVNQLATMLNNDNTLFNAITWSTTSVSNIGYVMSQIKKLFDATIER